MNETENTLQLSPPLKAEREKRNIFLSFHFIHFFIILGFISAKENAGFLAHLNVMQNVLHFLTSLLFLATSEFSHIFIDRHLADHPGIEPDQTGDCPLSHPIKGNFTTYSGEQCIYHMPGQRFYNKTKAEQCYATEADARRDGCRKSKK